MTAFMMTLRPLLVMTLLTPQNADFQARATKLITTFLSGNQAAVIGMLKGAPPIEQFVQAHDQVLNAVGAFESVTEVKIAPFQGMQVTTVSCAFTKGTADMTVTFDPSGDIAGFRIISVKPTTVPWDAPPYADPQKFTERHLTLGATPWQLPATLTMPKGAGPFPAVVLVHGSGPQDEDESIQSNKPFKDLAWGLASKGIAVLRYQKRTAAYGREMAPLNLTVMDETVDDAQAAIVLLGKTESIDPKRIYVVGHSLGGMLGPRIAAGTIAAGVVIMAGNTRPLEDLLVEQVERLKQDGLATQENVDSMRESRKYIQGYLEPSTRIVVSGATTPGSYWLDLRAYDPAKAAVGLKIPMFVMQGERDYQVGKADYEGWRNALKDRTDVKFKLYPALNHLFIAGTGPTNSKEYEIAGHVDAEVVADLSSWINGAK